MAASTRSKNSVNLSMKENAVTQLETSIISATVYPDRVRLTRRGNIKLKAGTHSLEISEIPLGFNPESLRASVFGSARARLLGAKVKHVYYSDQPSEAVRQLEDEIEKVKDTLARLEAKTELIKTSRANLDKLASQVSTYATALAAGETTLEKQMGFFDTLRRRSEKLDDENLGLQVELRQEHRKLEKLNHELDQLRSARPLERYQAVVDVELLLESELTVEVSYLLMGAGWKPLYDLRLLEKEGSSSLEVSYLAEVSQNTGETWDGISLTLSTARPALSSTLPELAPWYIRPPEAIVPKMRPAMAPQVFSQIAAKAQPASGLQATTPERVEEKSEELTAVVDATGTSVSYIIPTPVTVPPDGAPHKVTIARFNLTPILDYVTTPKLAQVVYRRARVENNSPYTLLPGEANILFVDEYMGSTPLELTAPEGSIELYLGSDNRLKVERELKRRDIDKRIIGGKRHLAYGYEIRLENMLPTKANLTLYDQIPVPRQEDIKVRLESSDPKPSEQSELNQLTWRLSLESKEKRSLRFDFSVESPQGMNVLGLP